MRAGAGGRGGARTTPSSGGGHPPVLGGDSAKAPICLLWVNQVGGTYFLDRLYIRQQARFVNGFVLGECYGGTYSVSYLVASFSVFGDVCDCVAAYERRYVVRAWRPSSVCVIRLRVSSQFGSHPIYLSFG